MPLPSIQILFEDNEIVVINKPSGLVVNKAESVRGQTVQGWMEIKLKVKSLKSKVTDFYKRGGVVHRLDKETSGIMILAKSEKSFVNLQKQFTERRVEKHYWALVHGKVEPPSSRLKLPIKRSSHNRRRFTIAIGGREAVTLYKRIKVFQKNSEKFSYLEIHPKTGRTHQIRVHFKHVGHPLVSDPFYLGEKTLAKDRLWCPRLFLHSYQISFYHPKTSKRVSFKAELAEDLKKALKKITNSQLLISNKIPNVKMSNVKRF